MDEYTKLAKEAVENYIKNKEIIKVPENLPSQFYNMKKGVFVTIHKDQELRGCIGTYLPTQENLAAEIISNAVAAASRDYRFLPISVKELPKLSYEVSILSEPVKIKNIKNHNSKKHGIIVRCADGRCGLLLPDLEGVDTTEQQIFISCQKGGINPETDNYELYEFTVEKHI